MNATISLVKPDRYTGTRRVYQGDGDACAGGDHAVGRAYESAYLSDYNGHGLCAYVLTFVTYNEHEDEMYEVVQAYTIGPAILEDGIWRPDDSADIIYEYPHAVAWTDQSLAQAACDKNAAVDLSYCLHLRGRNAS